MDMVYSKPPTRRGSSVYNNSNINHKKRSNRDGNIVRTVLYLFIMVGMVTVVGKISFDLFFINNIQINRVEVTGANTVSREHILSVAGLNSGTRYSDIDVNIIEERLLENSMIKEATVKKSFSEVLYVDIVESTPVCMSLYDNGKNSVPVSIGSDGTILQIGSSVIDSELLVLTGLKYQSVKLNAKLPAILVPFLNDLSDIQKNNKEYYDLISEIKIEGVGNNSFGAVMYTKDYKVPVLINNRLSKEKIQYIFITLNALDKKDILQNIEQLDFRSDKITFTTKKGA